MNKVVVATMSEVDDDRVMVDLPDGDQALLLRHAGSWFAVGAMCPHQFAPLLGGDVEDDGVLVCPLHGWRFRLTDGLDPDSGFACIPTWTCGVDGEELWIDLDSRVEQ